MRCKEDCDGIGNLVIPELGDGAAALTSGHAPARQYAAGEKSRGVILSPWEQTPNTAPPVLRTLDESSRLQRAPRGAGICYPPCTTKEKKESNCGVVPAVSQ